MHSNICGPTQTQSVGKNSYFLTFIDDCIRICWINLLKSKDQDFEYFKEFKIHVEKQSECGVKCLRTDKGGKFCSNEFLKICTNYGIKR